VNPLTHALKDENRVVRTNATIALGRTKDSRSVNSLIATLKDEEWLVRRYAARSLGELRATRAIKPLIDALDDKGFRATAAAAEGLRKITGQDLGLDPEKWRKWWEEKFRKDR
jgi:HEAT repeat protein